MHAYVLPPTRQIQDALADLQATVAEHYPTATFEVTEGDDPGGYYLIATLDLDDPDEVIDLTIDQVLSYQIDEELPVYLIAERTPERNRALLERMERERHLPPPPLWPDR